MANISLLNDQVWQHHASSGSDVERVVREARNIIFTHGLNRVQLGCDVEDSTQWSDSSIINTSINAIMDGNKWDSFGPRCAFIYVLLWLLIFLYHPRHHRAMKQSSSSFFRPNYQDCISLLKSTARWSFHPSAPPELPFKQLLQMKRSTRCLFNCPSLTNVNSFLTSIVFLTMQVKPCL